LVPCGPFAGVPLVPSQCNQLPRFCSTCLTTEWPAESLVRKQRRACGQDAWYTDFVESRDRMNGVVRRNS